jgi:ketosteroid isomerase-like protein
MEMRSLKAFAFLVLSAAFAIGAAGQASNADDPAKVRAAIAAVYDVYIKGVQTLDADLWMTNWDVNGVKFMQGMPAIVGKAAISNFAHARFAAFESRKMTINVDDVDVEGNLALARGSYISEDRLKSGSGPMITDGWFLTAFKKQVDGSWKIYRDCVASRVPPK